ncbi:YbhB/YbcL family Raf kinase inhibitor-like protein [Microbacterium gorillae]|uniref:YbhB/YbcL family Raf kinase inhibitor-like protein n=1 Tax=Microbacterium gorillae TaxID=1231063 RepID=UPI0006940A2C|nr:YbhB/YbcL family Raf kinase inhibitor-like protein [Microbacterium gorillae]
MFDYDPYDALARLRPVPSLTLTSSDFAEGEALPTSAWGTGAGGQDLSPQLSWSGVPEGARSLALSVFDPDAPTGSGFWHWAIYNLPVTTTSLPAGAGTLEGALPAGTVTLPNEMRTKQYIGAAPPAGTGTHRYFFVLDALDVDALELDADATPAILGFNRHFHTLARGVLRGTATPS